MNILIFSWRGPKHPNAGGAEASTHEHAKTWAKMGHNVTLFTSAFIGCKAEEIIDGVKIIRRGRQVFGVHIEAFLWYLFGKHEKFNLVVDQFHGIPFFTPIYVRSKKLAFIHEVTKEVWKLNHLTKPFNLIPAVIGTIFEPLIFKLFYHHIPFMTVSQSTKNDLINWGISENNVTVIHNGVNIPPGLQKYPKEEKKTIIYLGAISKDKGIEDALKTFAYINKNSNETWWLWVIGKSDSIYMRLLQNLISNLGLKGKVKFWGFVDDRKKFEFLSKSHLLINPSIREGWGLVVIEAAAVGTPTVGYNVSGLKDSIVNNKTGLLCEPNPLDCSKKITNLLKDSNLYNSFKRNCLKWSRQFSWEKSTFQSLKLIEGLVKKV